MTFAAIPFPVQAGQGRALASIAADLRPFSRGRVVRIPGATFT
jgi:hypothetical protein